MAELLKKKLILSPIQQSTFQRKKSQEDQELIETTSLEKMGKEDLEENKMEKEDLEEKMMVKEDQEEIMMVKESLEMMIDQETMIDLEETKLTGLKWNGPKLVQLNLDKKDLTSLLK